ncbi:MAG: hypothetical protein ABGZ17_09820 [Planctomycetaceae bacterium]
MNDPNRGPSRDPDQRRTRWTEQDVEHLLEGFFRDEIPPQIRELADEEGNAPVRASVEARSAGRWWVSAITAAAILVTVAWFVRDSQRPQNPHLVRRPRQVQPRVEPQPVVVQASVLPLLSLTVDRYATDVGMVEQRTALKWETVSVYQPETGVEVAWSIPEVNIELFGVK